MASIWPLTLSGNVATTAAPAAAAQPESVLGPWKHDIGYFAGNLQQGLPGLSREVSDTVWNIENIQHPGTASMLLRSVVLFGLVYLVAGSVVKYQTMGARGLDMIPHVGFWMEYPQLVMDGV